MKLDKAGAAPAAGASTIVPKKADEASEETKKEERETKIESVQETANDDEPLLSDEKQSDRASESEQE